MDYIYKAMEETEDSHSSCKNCELILRRTFLKGGFYSMIKENNNGEIINETK